MTPISENAIKHIESLLKIVEITQSLESIVEKIIKAEEKELTDKAINYTRDLVFARIIEIALEDTKRASELAAIAMLEIENYSYFSKGKGGGDLEDVPIGLIDKMVAEIVATVRSRWHCGEKGQWKELIRKIMSGKSIPEDYPKYRIDEIVLGSRIVISKFELIEDTFIRDDEGKGKRKRRENIMKRNITKTDRKRIPRNFKELLRFSRTQIAGYIARKIDATTQVRFGIETELDRKGRRRTRPIELREDEYIVTGYDEERERDSKSVPADSVAKKHRSIVDDIDVRGDILKILRECSNEDSKYKHDELEKEFIFLHYLSALRSITRSKIIRSEGDAYILLMEHPSLDKEIFMNREILEDDYTFMEKLAGDILRIKKKYSEEEIKRFCAKMRQRKVRKSLKILGEFVNYVKEKGVGEESRRGLYFLEKFLEEMGAKRS